MSLYGGAELANASRVVRKNTIQIAQDIPEESYDFVPAPGTRSVSQLEAKAEILTLLNLRVSARSARVNGRARAAR